MSKIRYKSNNRLSWPFVILSVLLLGGIAYLFYRRGTDNIAREEALNQVSDYVRQQDFANAHRVAQSLALAHPQDEELQQLRLSTQKLLETAGENFSASPVETSSQLAFLENYDQLSRSLDVTNETPQVSRNQPFRSSEIFEDTQPAELAFNTQSSDSSADTNTRLGIIDETPQPSSPRNLGEPIPRRSVERPIPPEPSSPPREQNQTDSSVRRSTLDLMPASIALDVTPKPKTNSDSPTTPFSSPQRAREAQQRPPQTQIQDQQNVDPQSSLVARVDRNPQQEPGTNSSDLSTLPNQERQVRPTTPSTPAATANTPVTIPPPSTPAVASNTPVTIPPSTPVATDNTPNKTPPPSAPAVASNTPVTIPPPSAPAAISNTPIKTPPPVAQASTPSTTKPVEPQPSSLLPRPNGFDAPRGEHALRVQLFEVLDEIRTNKLPEAQKQLQTLLDKKAVDPSFSQVVEELSNGKREEARDLMEKLLGSPLLFSTIDEAPKETAHVDQLNEIVTQKPNLEELRRLNHEDPQQRAQIKEKLEAYLAENKDPEAEKFLAALAVSDNDIPRAIALYEKALAENPDSDSYFLLGNLYFRRQKYPEALGAYQNSTKINNKHTKALSNTGVTFIVLEKNTEAEKSFRDAINSNESYAPAHYQLGRLYKSTGKSQEAFIHFKQAYALDHTNLPYKIELASAHTLRGEYKDADSLFTQALAEESKSAPLYYNAAQNKWKLHEKENALQLAKKAFELDSKNSAHSYLLALLEYELGQLDNARKNFENTISLDPQNGGALAGLALVAKDQNRLEEANTLIEKARALKADDPLILHNYGALLIAQGRYKEAIDPLEKALAAQIDHADYNLAIAYQNTQRYADARVLFEKVIQKEPENADALFNLALVELQLKNIQAGKRYLQELLDKYPQYEKSMQAQELLENS